MDKKTLQTLIVSALVVGVALSLFFLLFEKVEKQVFSPGSAKARQNPFLAAVRCLDKAGIPASGSRQRDFLNRLPAVRDLIFIHRPGSNYPESRIKNIAAWVEGGGTLAIHHDFSGQATYPLLDELGLKFLTQEQDQKPPGDNTKIPNKDTCNCTEEETLEDVFRGEKMTLAFDAGRGLPPLAPSSTALTLFRGKYGAHVVVRSVGEGTLVVLSDDRFLTNTRIGDNDHAFFLLKLGDGRDHAWILYNSVMPSIFSLVLKKMPMMVLSLTVLTIFAFFYLTRRIGPIYPPKAPAGRNIMEHLLAAGHFVRKNDKNSRQITRSRKVLEKKIAARYLYFSKKSRPEQMELVSKWTQMTVQDVRTALDYPVTTPAAYIRTAMLMKKIRDAIAANHKQTER
ncbi:MAG TPA: hypothetical protein DHV36_02060 [Desulfobacteraceae bacterium]|nr:hypothetical protein [Desulfobacteraceae bacterium]